MAMLSLPRPGKVARGAGKSSYAQPTRRTEKERPATNSVRWLSFPFGSFFLLGGMLAADKMDFAGLSVTRQRQQQA